MLDISYYEQDTEGGVPLERADGILVEWIHPADGGFIYGYTRPDGRPTHVMVNEAGVASGDRNGSSIRHRRQTLYAAAWLTDAGVPTIGSWCGSEKAAMDYPAPANRTKYLAVVKEGLPSSLTITELEPAP